MFQSIGKDTEDESLDLGNSLIPGGAIGHGAGDDGDFSEPATVLFAFDFNFHAASFDPMGMDVNDGGGGGFFCVGVLGETALPEEGVMSVRGGMARPSWGGVGRVRNYWSHSSIG